MNRTNLTVSFICPLAIPSLPLASISQALCFMSQIPRPDEEEPTCHVEIQDSPGSSPKSSMVVSWSSSRQLSGQNSEDSTFNKFSKNVSPSSSLDSSTPRRLIKSIPDMRLFRFARKRSQQQKERAKAEAQERAEREMREAAPFARLENIDGDTTPSPYHNVSNDQTDIVLSKPSSNDIVSAAEGGSASERSTPAKTPFKEKGGIFRNWRKSSGSEFFEVKSQSSPKHSDKFVKLPEDHAKSSTVEVNCPLLEKDRAKVVSPTKGKMTMTSFKRHSWDSSHSESSVSKPFPSIPTRKKSTTQGPVSAPTPETSKRDKLPTVLRRNVSEGLTSWFNKKPPSQPPTPFEESKP